MRRIGLALLLGVAALAVYVLRDPDGDGRAARERPETGGDPRPEVATSPTGTVPEPEHVRTILRVLVVGPDDAPLARAAVDVVGPGGRVAARGVADAKGHVELAVPPAAPLRCRVQADGHLPATLWAEVPRGTTLAKTFRLVRGPAIRGRVLDAAGAPLEGLSVGAEYDAPVPLDRAAAFLDHYPIWTDTGPDGSFELAPLFAGRHRVTVEHDAGEVVVEGVDSGRTDVEIVVPARPRPARVRVRVKVLDPAGVPVPRCEVWLGTIDGQGINQEYDGTVLAIHHRGVGPFRLRAHSPTDADGAPLPYAPGIVEGVTPREEPYVVRLRPGFPVRGTILVDGKPGVYYVSIVFSVGTGGSRVHATVQSDAEGRFAFEGIPAGPAEIFLLDDVAYLPSGNVPVEAGQTDVEVRARSVAKLEVTVRSEEPLLAAYGTVRERTAGGTKPVRWESALRPRGSPHLLLRFNWIYPDREYEIEVRGVTEAGWLRAPPTIVRGDNGPLAVTLQAGDALRGTVVRADGTPVVYAVVRVVPPGTLDPDDAPVPFPRATTDRDGRFALTGLPAGALTLFATAPGLVGSHVARDRADVRIVLRRARVVTGRVEGANLEDLVVEAWNAAGGATVVRPADVRPSGFFEVAVGPGAVRLIVRGVAGDDRFAISDPVAAGARGVRLVLSTGSRLEGALTPPAPGVRVEVEGAWARRSVATDADGRFFVRGLPAGLYALTATHRDGRSATAEARTDSGPVTLRLK